MSWCNKNSKCGLSGGQGQNDCFIPKKTRGYIIGSIICLGVAALIHGPLNIADVPSGEKISRWLPPKITGFIYEREILYYCLLIGGPVLVAIATVVASFMFYHACSSRTNRYKWLRWVVFGLSFIAVVGSIPVSTMTFEIVTVVGALMLVHSGGQIPDVATARTPDTSLAAPSTVPALSSGVVYSDPMSPAGVGKDSLSGNFNSGNVYSTSADYGKPPAYSHSQ